MQSVPSALCLTSEIASRRVRKIKKICHGGMGGRQDGSESSNLFHVLLSLDVCCRGFTAPGSELGSLRERMVSRRMSFPDLRGLEMHTKSSKVSAEESAKLALMQWSRRQRRGGRRRRKRSVEIEGPPGTRSGRS